jgi:hypothetical protein
LKSITIMQALEGYVSQFRSRGGFLSRGKGKCAGLYVEMSEPQGHVQAEGYGMAEQAQYAFGDDAGAAAAFAAQAAAQQQAAAAVAAAAHGQLHGDGQVLSRVLSMGIFPNFCRDGWKAYPRSCKMDGGISKNSSRFFPPSFPSLKR